MNTLLFGWPWLGLVVAAAMLVRLATERKPVGSPPRWRDPATILPLLWPMYLVHQFEEHGVDLFGRRYPFLAELCATLGYRELPRCPADPWFIFVVNAVAVWLVGAIAVIYRRKNPRIAACAWGVAAVNAFTHVVAAIRSGAYNPGVFTSVLLFAPLSLYMVKVVSDAGIATRRQLAARVVVMGLLVHAVLLGSLALRIRGWISYESMLLVNALNGLWPLAPWFGSAERRPVSA